MFLIIFIILYMLNWYAEGITFNTDTCEFLSRGVAGCEWYRFELGNNHFIFMGVGRGGQEDVFRPGLFFILNSILSFLFAYKAMSTIEFTLSWIFFSGKIRSWIFFSENLHAPPPKKSNGRSLIDYQIRSCMC